MKNWPWFLVSFLVIVADQVSKYWVLKTFTPYEPVSVLPMFNITLAYNTGSAFSFLSETGDWHRWFFTGFSIIMSGVLLVWMLRMPSCNKKQLLSLSLILGGAVGNVMDRILLGHVIDFIDVYYKTHHWPVFNVADSAICVGAMMLFFTLPATSSHKKSAKL